MAGGKCTINKHLAGSHTTKKKQTKLGPFRTTTCFQKRNIPEKLTCITCFTVNKVTCFFMQLVLVSRTATQVTLEHYQFELLHCIPFYLSNILIEFVEAHFCWLSRNMS